MIGQVRRITVVYLLLLVGMVCAGVPALADADGQAILAQGLQAFSDERYGDSVSRARELLSTFSDLSLLTEGEDLLINSVRWQSGCSAAVAEVKERLALVKSQRPGSTDEIEVLEGLLSRMSAEHDTYEARLAQYQQVIDIKPGTNDAYEAELGIARLKDLYDSREAAMNAYQQVASQHPESLVGEKAVRGLAGLHMSSKAYSQGIERLTALAEPRVMTRVGAAASFSIGKLMEVQGNDNGAVAAYKEAVRRSANSTAGVDAAAGIASVYVSAGDSATALVKLAEISNGYPNTQAAACALLEMGQIYERNNDLDWAFQVYEPLVTTYSRIPCWSQQVFVQACEKFYAAAFDAAAQNDYARAITQFDRALALWPSELVADGEYIHRVSRAHQAMGIQPVIHVDLAARYQKAIAHHTLDQDDLAEAEFRELMQSHPGSYLAIRAQGWIDKIRD